MIDMALIKGRANKSTDRRLWIALARAGLRGWKAQATDLPGKPDVIFRAAMVAVFADGCFWHGCHAHYRPPIRNRRFWSDKIKANRARDLLACSRLSRIGYRVFRVWEHDLRDNNALRPILMRLARAVESMRRPEIEGYIERPCHVVADKLLWCGPCFAATAHDIKDLTGYGVYVSAVCGRCRTVSRRIDGISIGRNGINGAGIN